MRLPIIVASILCSLVCCAGAQATPTKKPKPASSRTLGLDIRVEGGGWGNARKAQIETVLYAVADELLARLPEKLSRPIVVTHTDRNPVALYDRGPGGEYLVRLHASEERWYLYAYEFAHELCHIMSNYEENVGTDTSKYNQWFEETLCETASLFTLKNLAATWEASPPSPEWSKQAWYMRSFFDLLIAEGHRKLPPHTALAAWLGGQEERLRHDPYQREKNQVVANLLLPLFERDPENWDALSYLNLDPADGRNSLRQYLRNWYENAPAEHKTFIAGVLDLLELRDVVPVTSAAVSADPPPVPSAAKASQPGSGAAGPAGRSGPERR